MLVSAIISYARAKYPKYSNATTYPESFFIPDINFLNTEECIKFDRLSNRPTIDKTITTVANQIEYALPTNCIIENIEQLTVNINSEDYIFSLADYKQDISNGDYYRFGSTDAKFELYRNGEAIDTTGYTITIVFFPMPTAITVSNQTPDFAYPNLLCYRLINRLAMTGETPDTVIANIWQAEYDNAYKDIEKRFQANKTKTTTTITRIENMYGW